MKPLIYLSQETTVHIAFIQTTLRSYMNVTCGMFWDRYRKYIDKVRIYYIIMCGGIK